MAHAPAKNDFGILDINNNLTRSIISDNTDLDISHQTHGCQTVL